MTHCNAGALATAGHGTALGVIRAAEGQEHLGHRQRDAALSPGRAAHRLGMRAGRHSLHADHRQHGRPPDEPRRGRCGRSSARTASPPTATWRTRSAPTPLAVLAKRHGIPFYVAAPLSTFDPKIPDGSHIPIEERPADEVTGYRDSPLGARRRAGAQSGVRRHAGGADHRHHLTRKAWSSPPTASAKTAQALISTSAYRAARARTAPRCRGCACGCSRWSRACPSPRCSGEPWM